MAYRLLTQPLHDQVILTAKNYLNQTDFDIYLNPGSQQNAGINDNYPDIVLTTKGTNTVQFIIEVETSESVNLAEATNQWKKYATEINASFYLLVPLNYQPIAFNLCRQIGISARFGTYQLDSFGNVSNIKFE